MVIQEKTRLHLLDALRGFLLLNMIAYHGLWNLVYLFGVDLLWYRAAPGYLWQQFICWSFILLSGFCRSLSRSHLKRGLLVFGGGAIVSLVTLLFMPDSRILFGVLTCIGSCMLLMIPVEKLTEKIPASLGAIFSFCLFLLLRNCADGTLGFEKLVICQLPEAIYRNNLTAYLPGYFLFRLGNERGWNSRLFAGGRFPLLNAMGRHSLLIYLLHQPVLYGLSTLYFYIQK